MTFAASFPAWCGADGLPLSWRHYVHGLAWIARQFQRDQLAHAEAIRMAGTTKDDYEAWSNDVNRMIRVPRHG